MVTVKTEIVIDRPRSLVAEYASNPDNAPTWYRNISSATRQTEGPLSVGSRVSFAADFLGRHLAYVHVDGHGGVRDPDDPSQPG